MLITEAAEAENSLNRIQKLCRLISIGLKTIFALVCVYWLLVVLSMLISVVDPGLLHTDQDVNALSAILYFLYGAIIAALFVVFIKIFSSAAKGETPFTMVQVKRLRLIACFLLGYALLDSAIAYNTALLKFEAINSGYVSTSDSAIVAFNFAPFVAAAVVFAFSFVFQYGVLLQEFSDETL